MELLDGTVNHDWLDGATATATADTFSACMQILYDMHDFYCTAVHVLVVLSSGSWVPAGIPTASARVCV